jgi:hypothetical protein
MQTVDDILVLGVDAPLGNATQPMQVLFINAEDPENPRLSKNRYDNKGIGFRRPPSNPRVIPRCARQTMSSGMRMSAARHRNTEVSNAQVSGT